MNFGKTEELLMDKQEMKGILGKDSNRCKAKAMQKQHQKNKAVQYGWCELGMDLVYHRRKFTFLCV